MRLGLTTTKAFRMPCDAFAKLPKHWRDCAMDGAIGADAIAKLRANWMLSDPVTMDCCRSPWWRRWRLASYRSQPKPRLP